MIELNLLIIILMYICGCLSYVLKRKHLLSMLLSLEFIVLSLFFLLIMSLMYFNFEFFFSMIFLTFSVCEGSLGLSILVSMVRTHGNDYFQSLNILN
uniref:NADH-ubiquinone oxidoreductase chain 4L n=2 Tax=Nepsalus TaxID=2029030 RepID=A0AAU6QFN1_9NEOP|nr:NADH dehydrogenase subunit 4L [Nepsalus decorillus]ATI25226.1 NADH dehydrogenase subunit 4L [Nepsalus jezoensis]URT60564.1 NADH dehydrogenase subunit 4L [Nepsalus decorillus]URT60577.1 NADH dehydrogenase subunit 4L [Nepsalus decorillus]URT60590.1 NADH dehydrogenase subunit 4L [Nepsalus decorillus]URT60603.1 NADH dehydrogenase subunit 4L [Nepsalus decorillus]